MKYIIIILIFLVPFSSQSQSENYLEVVNRVDSLVNLSRILTEEGNYDSALNFGFLAENVSKKNLIDSALYASACFNLGRVFYHKKDYLSSEPWYHIALNIRLDYLGKENLDYAESLNDLGVLYVEMNELQKVEALYLESKRIREKILGKNNLVYAGSLNNLGNYYSDAGNEDEAIKYYTELLEIRKNILGTDDLEYATCLNNLALSLMYVGNYNLSDSLHNEAFKIRLRKLNIDHSDCLQSLTNMAGLYSTMGDLRRAEKVYLQLLNIESSKYGINSLEVALICNNLAINYHRKGDYKNAEPLYLKALKIRHDSLGVENPYYARTLNNLSVLYLNTGNFERAEPLLIEAIHLQIGLLGDMHPRLANSYNNLGMVYMEQRKYDISMKYYKLALEIRRISEGENSISYAGSLNNIGNVLMAKGELDSASNFIQKSLQIKEKIIGSVHADYAGGLINLGEVYLKFNNLILADSLFKRALDILGDSLNITSHEFYRKGLIGELKVNYKLSNWDEYVKSIIDLIDLDKNSMNESASFMSSDQLEKYVQLFDEDEGYLMSLIRASNDSCIYYSKLLHYGFNYILYKKNFLLDIANRIIMANRDSGELVELKDQLKEFRGQFANAIVSASYDSLEFVKLNENISFLEKRIARLLLVSSKDPDGYSIDFYRELLADNEAIIEFTKFGSIDGGVYYGAFVLTGEMVDPKFVPLVDEDSLRDIIGILSSRSKIAQVYSISSLNEHRDLYSVLWEPIDLFLSGKAKIYFSPSGEMHKVNLAMVPVSEVSRIGDQYELVLLGSTHQLAEMKLEKNQFVTASDFVVGGIHYQCDTTWAEGKDLIVYRNSGLEEEEEMDSTYRGSVLRYLPHSKVESLEIAEILEQNGYGVQLDTGYMATETAFKELGSVGPSPRIIHAATHGYFFPDPKEEDQLVADHNAYRSATNPLIRSGLLMACSSPAWLAGSHQGEGDDGVLTAYEIAQMDLRNTELVVLSACETALGDIIGTEGVYGLQRAFRIAGAKNLIMTLWKVNDEVSMQFFTKFYTYWIQDKMSLSKAFYSAQKDLRQQYPDSPYLWAGFVLLQ